MEPIKHEPSKRPTGWKILEKIVIPLALVILGGSQAYVAHEQLELQSADARSNLQLKYVELFYHDVQDRDPAKQKAAIALLSVMQPIVARMISKVVLANPQAPAELRQQVKAAVTAATSAATAAERFGPLTNFKLVVYYEKAAAADATHIRDMFNSDQFSGGIDLREEAPDYLSASKYGYHIRYDDGTEEEPAADYLLKALQRYLPGRDFDRVAVTGRGGQSDGVLTVFLFSKAVAAK